MRQSVRYATTLCGALSTVAVLPAMAFAATEGEASSGLPQLDVTTYPSQLFWLAVTFVVLYVLMSRVALPKIADVLEERQERIESDLGKAEQLKTEAEAVRADYEKAVAEARASAHALSKDASDDVAAKAAEAETEAAKKSAEQMKRAEARIANAKRSALEGVRTVAKDVSTDAVRKLIGVDVASDDADAAVGAAMEGRS